MNALEGSRSSVRFGRTKRRVFALGMRLVLLTFLGVALGLSADGSRSVAGASLVEALDLRELVAEADRVALARVLSEQSHHDSHGQIVTDFAMQIEESIKGDDAPGAAIVVRRLGGEVGGVGMRVAGEPGFQVGETVLVFAARAGQDAALRPVGMAQGALRVFDKDGVRFAHSVRGGLTPVRRAGGQLKSAPLAVEQPRRLDELLGEIRALVKVTRDR